jgi:hypothetical protein
VGPTRLSSKKRQPRGHILLHTFPTHTPPLISYFRTSLQGPDWLKAKAAKPKFWSF